MSNLAEFEAQQVIIRSHPDYIQAVDDLALVIRLLHEWQDGLLLATEAKDAIRELFGSHEQI